MPGFAFHAYICNVYEYLYSLLDSGHIKYDLTYYDLLHENYPLIYNFYENDILRTCESLPYPPLGSGVSVCPLTYEYYLNYCFQNEMSPIYFNNFIVEVTL